MKDLKYLAALTIPLSALLSLILREYWSFLTPVYAFAVIPIIELLLSKNNNNYSEFAVEKRTVNRLFDYMLYLNVPIVFGLLSYGFFIINTNALQTFEFIGIAISIGIVLGVNGINVAHELGHRQQTNERFLGKLLLLPSLYMHFYMEHNFGHHLHAATKEDPATARYNQSVYSFWITSVFKQYISAWRIQKNRLQKSKHSFFSVYNDMFWYLIFQSTYLITVFINFGRSGLIFSLLAALVGFLLLETVNYIEHYGLMRFKTKSGRYERVREVHSWNSNHVIGRIVLYELTRHSDHHFKSAKKYQVLEYHDISPEIPYGYPTSMVLAMVPPLWFTIMNKRVPKEMLI